MTARTSARWWPGSAVARDITDDTRSCPFCASRDATVVGTRAGGSFVRCRSCRSVYRDLSPAGFAALHEQAQGEDGFIEAVQEARGLTPNFFTWDQVGLAARSVIEIGPGTGHLLAAARARGCDVYGVETNPVHRRFIEDIWGIPSVVAQLDDLEPGLQVDAVLAVNVLEHVYDIEAFLHEVRPRLVPGGRLFISTVNARGFALAVTGPWFSMCKEVDHVSFPSRAGLERAAARGGWRVDRIWNGELPFETPVGLAVALRDWRRERELPAGSANGPADQAPAERKVPAAAAPGGSHRVAAAISRLSESRVGPYEPTQWLATRSGRASSIMGLLIG